MVWLIENFGGIFSAKKNGKAERRRTLYEWRVSAEMRQWILEGAMPFFVLKKKQAEIGLNFLKTMDPSRQDRSDEKVSLQDKLSRDLNSLNLTRTQDWVS
jgi:hypothetical protein